MPDIQYTPIVLDPNTNSVSGPMAGLPPVVQPAPQPIAQQTVPLQPIPHVTPVPAIPEQKPIKPLVQQPPSPAATLPDRQTELHQQLETLTQEESKLLGTIKDWVAWIQGAETKKQAIERELANIDKQFKSTSGSLQTSATPTKNGPDRAGLEKQIREAEAQLKTVQDQQKIEEKKAFDNYSAGGINRDGLLKEMERISLFYATPTENAKTKITGLHNQLNPVQPATTNLPPIIEPTIIPTTPPMSASAVPPTQAVDTTVLPTTAPLPQTTNLTPQAQKIIECLRNLPATQSGYLKQLLVDLPAQGTGLTVERAADGNGVIILAGTEQTYTLGHHFPDADLILAGLGADNITALPTGTLTGSQITSPVQAGL
ncbi:MAG: hypothetical protein ACD_43C00035G0001 [uncultured bacterium]|nr:MAG: hypothetical protein ACD_43C00035G0001 [uncultured bacterium]